MRCRRIARQETKDYHGMAAVVCPGSLHWDASHRRHLLTRGSAYDQKQIEYDTFPFNPAVHSKRCRIWSE